MTIDKNGDPIPPKELCDVQREYEYKIRNESIQNLKTATLIGEFGAIPDDDAGR